MTYVQYLASDFNTSINNLDEKMRAALNQSNISGAEEKLRTKIEELETKENTLLAALGITSGSLDEKIQELNRRIQNYNELTQFTLSGQNLYDKFIAPYQSEVYVETKKLNESFRQAVTRELKSGNSDIPEKVARMKCQEELYLTVTRLLNKDIKSTKEVVYSTKGLRGLTNIANLDINSLSAEMKRRASEVARKEQKTQKDLNIDPNNIEVKVSASKSYVDLWVAWKKITKGKTGKQVSDGEAAKASQELLNNILAILPESGVYKTRFINAYNAVISANPKAIFVGNNANEITGLLGEIQAMIYLDIILNGDNSDMSKIQWYGGTIDTLSHKKPHADVLLAELGKIFGIQVKNTTSLKETKTYYFSTMNAENFLTHLEKYGLSSATKDYLREMYAAYGFNIAVAEKDGIWAPASNNEVKGENAPQFVSGRLKLDELPDVANEIFSAFAAELMYMSTNDFVDANVDSANVLYILGSAGAQLSSQLLREKDEIVKNEKNRVVKRFSVIADYPKIGAYTIADAYNHNKSAFQSNKSKQSLEFELTQVKLTSSYVFSF